VSTAHTPKSAPRPSRLMLALVAAIALILGDGSATFGESSSHVQTQDGQITFARQMSDDEDSGHTTYVVDPDGAHLRALASPADFPRWSPDGTRLALGDMPCMFGGACAAVIVNIHNAKARTLPDPAPEKFDLFYGCTVWSPGGDRLACGGEGSAPGVSGIYTVRATDGRGLTEVLSCADGCGPADYSPDGRHLALVADDAQGITQLYTVRLDGTGLHQLTSSDVPVNADSSASWSPSGNRLLFSRAPADGHRRAIFEVNADGSEQHQVPIPRCGGATDVDDSLGCFGPSWSPDGSKIAFCQFDSGTGLSDVYTVDADATHRHQVTHDTSGLPLTSTDWGTRKDQGARPHSHGGDGPRESLAAR
jgi:Tol biopolymer transport system component